MPWAALAVGALSGAGSAMVQMSANERAAIMQDKQFRDWMALHVPSVEEQKVILDRFVNQGVLEPKLQKAIAQDPSAFEKIVTSASNRAAQNRALSELESIGNQGGLRLQDKAALQDAMLSTQAQDRAEREGIAAEMARRGLGGSGYDVAARLQGQQATADRNANNSLKVAAQAQDRALQAIEQGGQLASQYRTQDFNEQAQKASAADRINQFNTQNLRDVNAANVAAQNAAAQYNLAQKQRIADQNTQLANNEQMYNKELLQKQYDNQLQRLAGATNQMNATAGTVQKGGQIMGNTISNIGSGAADAMNSYNNYQMMDDYFKKKGQQQQPQGGY